MQFVEIGGRVFKRKADYVNSIVRACARKLENKIVFQFNISVLTLEVNMSYGSYV